MAGYSYRQKWTAFKIETVEGTEAAPAAATDSILTRDFAPVFLEAQTRQRNIDRPTFGAQPSTFSDLARGATFEVELAGSGTATGVPSWMKLLRVCGFDAGVVGGANVIQTPISTGIPTGTFWTRLDAHLAKFFGARGNATFTFEDNEVPFIGFDVRGRPDTTGGTLAVTDATSGQVYTMWQEPVVCSTENTEILLDTFALPTRRLTISTGNVIEQRSLINPPDTTKVADRLMSGEIVFEVPTLAEKDYWANVYDRGTVALAVTHGLVAGNIIELAAPKVELGAPTFSEEQGMLMATMPLSFLPNAGNDELIITTS